MVLRVNSIVQTYGVPEMRTTQTGRRSVIISGFVRQMQERVVWVKLFLCPERFGKIIPKLYPKTKIWVNGVLRVESYVSKGGEARVVKRVIVEGMEVVEWGPDPEKASQEQESQEESSEEELEKPEEDELFPF